MPAHRWGLPAGTQRDWEEEAEGLEHELLPEMGIPVPQRGFVGTVKLTMIAIDFFFLMSFCKLPSKFALISVSRHIYHVELKCL